MPSPIKDIVEGLIAPVSGIISEFVVDKDKRNEIAKEIALTTATLSQQLMMAQIKVNEAQASHKSLFVSGARPAIMWLCGFGLAYQAIIYPTIAIWVSDLPPLDTALLVTTLTGLLGLGGMRSWDKANGVATNALNK